VGEHLIRLRGGWEATLQGTDDAPSQRISLPAHLSADWHGRVRLIRRFGRPRVDWPNESLSLRMLRVPGLARVTLNGRLLVVPGMTGDSIEFRDVDLAERNELVLEVLVPAALRVDASEAPWWGEIALVVHSGPVSRVEPLA
jgi:hypothetical protein